MSADESTASDTPSGSDIAASDCHALPPEPAVRHVTPAPEDFANPPGFANYIWPVFWVLLICGLVGVVCAGGWSGFEAH